MTPPGRPGVVEPGAPGPGPTGTRHPQATSPMPASARMPRARHSGGAAPLVVGDLPTGASCSLRLFLCAICRLPVVRLAVGRFGCFESRPNRRGCS
jgi:hypothetical protein